MAQVVKNGEIVEEQEEIQQDELETEETEEETEEVTDETEEPEDSDDSEEPEPWQLTDDEQEVPLSTHIRLKKKLKGKISERDEELDKLRAEVESLKTKPERTALKRPREEDFDTTKEYETALNQYEEDAAQERLDRLEAKRQANEIQRKQAEKVNAAVEEHYERAGKLIEGSGIDPTRYKKADENVRLAVDSILPKQGDKSVDWLISVLGKGSEKVMYFVGNNKTALNEFKSLLIDDKTGMKAVHYLGRQQERLTNPKKRTSRAPAPTPSIKGDEVIGSNAKALKKAYNKAHGKGNIQEAYNVKKRAKAAGADVSKW